MRVTLDVFSGRPNPTWRLSGRQARELRERAPARAVAPAPPPGGPGGLGYRGIVVTEDAPGELIPSPVPQQVRIAAPIASDTAAATAVVDDLDTADWLLTTAARAVTDDVAGVLTGRLDELRRERGAAAAEITTEAPAGDGEPEADIAFATARDGAACHPRLSPMRLGFWNTPVVQPYNNCYNYATNFASGTLAQPGRRSGQTYGSFRCADVLAAAMRDGLRSACAGEVAIVALGIWPGFDFHWWRLHLDGAWAHKIGWWPAQTRDNAFREIANGLTPATCDRGPYNEFCGYYFAPLSMWVA